MAVGFLSEIEFFQMVILKVTKNESESGCGKIMKRERVWRIWRYRKRGEMMGGFDRTEAWASSRYGRSHSSAVRDHAKWRDGRRSEMVRGGDIHRRRGIMG